MRKLFASILMVICLASLGAVAVACNPAEPNYYILTYEEIDGLSYDFKGIQNGAQVKEGYEVSFTYSYDDSMLMGEPVVKINGEAEYPDLDGVYSFKMTEDTTVSVSGLWGLSSYGVIFDKGDWRINYLDENGNELSSLDNIDSGTTVSFTLDISVYYDRQSNFSVLANTNILTAKDGVYTFTVNRDTTVSISGLELEKSFIEKEDGGSGTKDDPFKIQRPIDLYVMADLVSDSFYADGRFAVSYYELANDIDMEGEQLFVIGDASADTFFGGNFNGNHHTIKNYYIKDTIIEQSNFTEVFVPALGLFGQVSATMYGIPEIYDVNLENFEIIINAAKFQSSFSAGGVAGIAVGAEIRNCTASGKIIADASNNLTTVGYIGGIVGFIQSAYSEGVLNFRSAVSGCSSDVLIEGQSGYLFGAGGIAGYLYSYYENSTAYIYNCYATGNVAGAMNAGGIVGYVTPYSSVKNCYYVGSVNAYNELDPGMYSNSAYAYAGGIAGYAGFDSVVSNCFSVASTYATQTKNSSYAKKDDIVAGISGASAEYIESSAALVLNNTHDKNNINKTYLTETLGWSESDWSFDGEYPVLKSNDGIKTSLITINFVGVSDSERVFSLADDNYKPIGEWYGNKLDRFVTSGKLRSYGYYFDAELTLKVPYGYVFTGDQTIYCGFADYNDVAGIYYPCIGENGAVYFELLPDGTLIYRDGGINVTTEYIYNGKTVTLYNTPVFTEVVAATQTTAAYSYYTSGIATLEDGVLTLVNNLTYTQNSPLLAVKEIENFVYGDYYSGSNEYTFYPDGTGLLNGNEISYTVSNGTVTIYNNNSVTSTGVVEDGLIVSIGNVSVSAYDSYKGTWENSATSLETYTFDGKGGWNYEYYSYVNGVKTVLTEDNGTYTLNSDGTLLLDNGETVSFDKNGFVSVTSSYTQTYYKPDSYVGTWRFFYKEEAIEITFGGIGTNGYGYATVSYETLGNDVELTYDVREDNGTDYVYLYQEDTVLGVLNYNSVKNTLDGFMYSYKENEMLYAYYVTNGEYDENGDPVIVDTVTYVSFCLYDEYYGDWISSEWGIVNFNGFGSYELASTIAGGEILTLPVSGKITIKGENVSYKLNNATMDGSFVYGEVTYTLGYNAEENSVSVSANGNTFKMYRLDPLYGLQLSAGNVITYTFDGGSSLKEGGKVKTSEGDTYGYRIESDSIVMFDENNATVGTITISNDKYIINTEYLEDVELHIVNGFTGSWLVGGTLGDLIIGEIGASNTAQGNYLGSIVTFNYNVTQNLLSFEYENYTYYIHVMSSESGNELKITDSTDLMYATVSIGCISSDLPDNYRGKYTSADGSYLVLDGLGNSAFGGGTAVMYNEDDEVVYVYSYNFNSFGMIRLKGDRNYILVPAEASAEGAYVLGDVAFVIETPDRFYLATSKDYYGVIYTFDGIGTVKTSDGKEYTYTFDGIDELNLLYNFTFIDKDGVKHSVDMDYGSISYELRFNDDLTGISITILSGWGEGSVNYNFVNEGVVLETVTDADGNSTVTEYTYVYTTGTNDDGEVEYYDLTFSDKNGVKTEYTLEVTGEVYEIYTKPVGLDG